MALSYEREVHMYPMYRGTSLIRSGDSENSHYPILKFKKNLENGRYPILKFKKNLKNGRYMYLFLKFKKRRKNAPKLAAQGSDSVRFLEKRFLVTEVPL
jgi:hypothetical protein